MRDCPCESARNDESVGAVALFFLYIQLDVCLKRLSFQLQTTDHQQETVNVTGALVNLTCWLFRFAAPEGQLLYP